MRGGVGDLLLTSTFHFHFETMFSPLGLIWSSGFQGNHKFISKSKKLLFQALKREARGWGGKGSCEQRKLTIIEYFSSWSNNDLMKLNNNKKIIMEWFSMTINIVLNSTDK